MLTDLHIRNFQAHASLDLELGKLTVISGPSNTGKSSVVRAARVLLSNPKGDWYRRGDETVTIQLSTASAIAAFHRAKQVRYELTDVRGTSEFTAVGTSVPDEITAELRVDPDLQVVDQFAPPFLLSEPPSAVARTFGQLTRADLMMTAVKVAGSSHREAKSKADAYSEIVRDTNERLSASFGWYDDAARAMKDAYPSYLTLVASRDAMTRLSELRPRLVALLSVVVPPVAAEGPALSDASAALAGIAQGLHNLATLRARLVSALATYENELGHAKDAEHRHAVATTSRDQLIGELENCPACGQPITDVNATHHLAEFA